MKKESDFYEEEILYWLFVALFVFVSLLGIGYQVSYQYVMDRQMARQQDKQQRSVAVKGEAEKMKDIIWPNCMAMWSSICLINLQFMNLQTFRLKNCRKKCRQV